VEVVEGIWAPGKVYGVKLARMEEHFKFYWMSRSEIRAHVAAPTEKEAVGTTIVEDSLPGAYENSEGLTTCTYCGAEIEHDENDRWSARDGAGWKCLMTWFDNNGVGEHLGHSPMNVQEMTRAIDTYEAILIRQAHDILNSDAEHAGSLDATVALYRGLEKRVKEALTRLTNRQWVPGKHLVTQLEERISDATTILRGEETKDLG
jgi:hypothetical protein